MVFISPIVSGFVNANSSLTPGESKILTGPFLDLDLPIYFASKVVYPTPTERFTLNIEASKLDLPADIFPITIKYLQFGYFSIDC